MQLEHEEFIGILMRFAQRVALKLREMNITRPVNTGTSKSKRLFNELFIRFEQMKQLRADIATAETLQIRQDMKQAALDVAKNNYQEAEKSMVGCVVEILVLHLWTVADVVAKALVRELTNAEDAQKAIGRGENAAGREVLPLRCFIHLAPAMPINCGQTKLVRWYASKVASKFGPGKVQVEDAGWMLGQLTSTDGVHGTPDGVFMIVKAKNADTALALLVFLKSCCAGKVSLAHLFNEDQASRLNAGADQPCIDPLETH